MERDLTVGNEKKVMLSLTAIKKQRASRKYWIWPRERSKGQIIRGKRVPNLLDMTRRGSIILRIQENILTEPGIPLKCIMCTTIIMPADR